MQKRFVAFIALSCLLTGCRYILSEPFPAFEYASTSPKRLPKQVLEAFAATRPGRQIEKVETESLRGRIEEYRIWFRSESGQSESVIFDREGKTVSPPGRFPLQPQPAPNKSVLPTAAGPGHERRDTCRTITSPEWDG